MTALRLPVRMMSLICTSIVLPIALHKAVNSRAFTREVEGALAKVGLLRRFGSPVTVVAVRCDPS